jgi:hypothetical protein
VAKIPIDGKVVVERTVQEWSRLYGWVERARQHDEEQLERKKALRQEYIDNMNDRHMKLGMELQEKARAQMDTLIAAGNFGAIATVNAYKLGLDAERLAAGAATKQLAVTGKDGGKVEMEVIVETFWGRGTDPRKHAESSEPVNDAAETDEDEDTELIVEVDTDVDD